MTSKLVCVDPALVKEFWPHVRPLLKSAFDKTKLSRFDCVESDVLSGRSIVWLSWVGAIECAASTIIEDTDGGKVCVITACGGNSRNNWLPFISQIEAYAKNEGCAAVRIYGRKGWTRVLDGYRDKYAIMDKVL